MKIVSLFTVIFISSVSFAGSRYECPGRATVISAPTKLKRDEAKNWPERTVRLKLKIDEITRCRNYQTAEKALAGIPSVGGEYRVYFLPLDKAPAPKKNDKVSFVVKWDCGKNDCYEKIWTQTSPE